MAAVRTHPGITRRILVAVILLTLVAAGGIAWLGVDTVGDVIEQRLVRERAANAASLISQQVLPRTDLMMRNLSRIFGQGCEVAADPNDSGQPLASSMHPADRDRFTARVSPGPLPHTVVVGGHRYVVGHATIPQRDGSAPNLYLLVDEHVLAEAKSAAIRPILLGAIPALAAVIAAAFYVSRTITAPIRRLSAQIEAQVPGEGEGALAQSRQRGDGDPGNFADLPQFRDVELDAPRELADLASSFNRMLARLRQTQQRLLDASRLAAVGKIASSVAHEVRNPLAGIRMNLQLLQQHLAGSGREDESLNIAINELDRLDSIVQEMLILGRKAEPRPEPTDLHAVAEEVLQLLSRRLSHGNIQPTLQGERAMAAADPAQIKQVVLNLILNALDAMPQGGRLALSTSAGDGVARLAIDDSGTGLALEAGQDPFAWFSTSKSAGSGIGLAVCKQIIDAHGGRIGLQRLDQGTRAWIELPAMG